MRGPGEESYRQKGAFGEAELGTLARSCDDALATASRACAGGCLRPPLE